MDKEEFSTTALGFCSGFFNIVPLADGDAGAEGREAGSLRLHGPQLTGLNSFQTTPRPFNTKTTTSSHAHTHATLISTHSLTEPALYFSFFLLRSQFGGGKLLRRLHALLGRSVARLPQYFEGP